MLRELRERFNAEWTPAKYAELNRRLREKTGTEITFRVAETPCFFERSSLEAMVRAGQELTGQLTESAEYMHLSDAAVPDRYRIPGESRRPLFMTVDFGLVREQDGGLTPRLVEMQAFPSVFGYQSVLAQAYAEVYGLEGYGWFLGGLDEAGFWEVLRKAIVGDHDPEQVILAEVTPEEQKTLPDFRIHAAKLGIPIVDIATLKKKGSRLMYQHAGREIPVSRIYNRAIVDEIERKGITLGFDYRDELEVEWAGHPNWYFRISKFSLPFLDHSTVPGAVFLHEWMAGRGRDRLPESRDRWVLKPLYSFAGNGIEFAPSQERLEAIPEAERCNYLLQERVAFEPVIATPEGPTQAEVRILYVWPPGGTMQPMISLVRMGRGQMMGVDHNRHMAWVGGSAGFFPLT